MTSENPLAQWALDRGIVLSRVIEAPRDLVFVAWTDPAHLPNWFGPAGFKIETREIDVRVGGRWTFDMVAPDGQRWSSRMTFLSIERPDLIEFDHGADVDDDPARFRTTLTFDQQDDGMTVITLRQLHPTKARRRHRLRRRRVRLSDPRKAGPPCGDLWRLVGPARKGHELDPLELSLLSTEPLSDGLDVS